MPGTVLDAADAAVNKTDKSPCPHEGQADHKQISKIRRGSDGSKRQKRGRL